jgi:hypothetical protein
MLLYLELLPRVIFVPGAAHYATPPPSNLQKSSVKMEEKDPEIRTEDQEVVDEKSEYLFLTSPLL